MQMLIIFMFLKNELDSMEGILAYSVEIMKWQCYYWVLGSVIDYSSSSLHFRLSTDINTHFDFLIKIDYDNWYLIKRLNEYGGLARAEDFYI